MSELIDTIVIKYFGSNFIKTNIYYLVEFTALIWLFYNWGSNQRKISFYIIIASIGYATWLFDNVIIHTLQNDNATYRIVHAYIIIFLSVDRLNFLLLAERNLRRNPQFIICCAFLMVYMYSSFVEVFFLMDLHFSNDFYGYLLLILNIINLLASTLFAIAALWIPKKQKFILPYYS